MQDWIKERKIYVIVAIIIGFGLMYYFFIEKNNDPAVNEIENSLAVKEKGEVEKNNQQESIQVPEIIIVDVKGQVKKPGVYQSSQGERVIDVIKRAGGLTEQADESQVNFAEHVQDAMVIYIPLKGEEGIVGTGGISANPGGTANQPSKINLNKADINELQNLPGIGPSKAAAIVEYRETSGPFKNEEDLKNISGIGDKTFEKLKDLIVVH